MIWYAVSEIRLLLVFPPGRLNTRAYVAKPFELFVDRSERFPGMAAQAEGVDRELCTI